MDYLPSRFMGPGTQLHTPTRIREIDSMKIVLNKGADMEVNNMLGQTHAVATDVANICSRDD